MEWTRYRFRSQWALPAPPAVVYATLERPWDYPRWWRQVREATRLDATSCAVRVRALLPCDLAFTVCEVRRDPAAGVLQAALSGDIVGWARWMVVADQGAGTVLRYDQVVDVTKPLFRRLAVPARPIFRANHGLMMRAGRRGLLAHLEGV